MAAGDLVTLADVATWLGANYVSANDALYQRLITVASTTIQSYLERQLGSQAYSEYRNGTGGNSMPFMQWPVTAVSQIIIGSTSVPPLSPPTLGGFGFIIDASPNDMAFVWLRGRIFDRGIKNITLGYTAGYNLATAQGQPGALPADIYQVTLEFIQLLLGRQTIDANVASESVPGAYSASYRDGSTAGGASAILPAPMQAMLTSYQRRVWAD